jgi:hypothetical protein
MPRTDNQTLIEQLLGVKSWPVFFYEIQVKDEGKGTAGTGTFTADDKAWDSGEWITNASLNNAVFIDKNGTSFTISANSDDTLTLSGTPVTGDFDLKRWLYLASYTEGYTGTYLPITFNGKSYLPYPVKIGNLGSYELGQFPQVSLSMPNPGVQVLDVYRALEKYNGLRGCTVNIITAFIDENGDLYEDTDIQLIDQFIIQQPTITNTLVTFNLQNFGNLADKKIPARTYSKLTCGFIYQDENCKNIGTTSSCNKLLCSYLFTDLQLTHTSGNSYSTTEDLSQYVVVDEDPDPEVANKSLKGCNVEVPKENYLWRITKFTDNSLEISTTSRTKTLSSYLTNGQVNVNIIDKFSCKGHADEGDQTTPVWTDVSTNDPDGKKTELIEQGNLLVQNDFGMVLGESGLWEIVDGLSTEIFTSSGNESQTVEKSFALIINKTIGTHSIHVEQDFDLYNTYPDPLPVDEDTTTSQLEIGHHYILYLRYYGYSLSSSASSFRVQLTATYHGSQYYFNFTTKSWVGSSTSVQIPLRSNVFTTNLYGTEDSSAIMSLIQKDEYICVVPLNIPTNGNRPHVIGHFNINIGSPATDTATFIVQITNCGFYRLIQHEHFGGFPAMPMSKLWYV